METLIAAAFALVFGTCWVMEMRINSKLRLAHQARLHTIHAEGWEEGRQYEINRRNAQHPRNRGQFSERTKP